MRPVPLVRHARRGHRGRFGTSAAAAPVEMGWEASRPAADSHGP
jgi:hypothetical protein